jgi:hypothetical protein
VRESANRHSLGLGHSDDPDDMMYPYYKISSKLSWFLEPRMVNLFMLRGHSISVDRRAGGDKPPHGRVIWIHRQAPGKAICSPSLDGFARREKLR